MVPLITLTFALQAEEASSADAWVQAIQALVAIALAIFGIWLFRRWISARAWSRSARFRANRIVPPT